MGCERHKLHIYRTGNVEILHFETSQMECGRLIREDQPAFFFTFFYMPNGNGGKKMPQLSSENCGWLPHRDSNSVKQNQNLVCYHYTMGQSILILRFCGRKDTRLFRHFQIFREKSFAFARSLWGNVMCVAQNHSAHHMLR